MIYRFIEKIFFKDGRNFVDIYMLIIIKILLNIFYNIIKKNTIDIRASLYIYYF